jgi:predicted membrane protein
MEGGITIRRLQSQADYATLAKNRPKAYLSGQLKEGKMSRSSNVQGRIFWGLMLIVLGILFLFDQMGRIDFGELVSRYWPVVFIIISISIIIGNGFRSTGSALFFLALGTFFLLMELEIFDRSLWHYWPVFIIAAGIWVLMRPMVFPSFSSDKKAAPELNVDELKISAVFAGIKRRIESPAFKGGKAEVVLGSLDLDLAGSGLSDGQATVELSAVLGSIELRVPRAWQVVIEGSPILGNIEDKRRPVAEAERKGILHMKASVVLGNIEIKD